MKIAIIGYGKMGKMIESLAVDRNHTIVLKTTGSDPCTLDKLQESDADVAIEFTEPSQAISNINLCFDAGIPVVTGTTGWLDSIDEVSAHCKQKNGTLFYASNFSIGVNIVFQVNKVLAKLMNHQLDYEVKMEEIHHTEKKDAPSGTAITLGEGILENLDRKKDWVNSQSSSLEDLEIISERIENVPGTHRVRYDSNEDFIELIHEAKGRQGFALGAIRAAEWVKSKTGVFTMSDMLDLKP